MEESELVSRNLLVNMSPPSGWICPECETENVFPSAQCSACGIPFTACVEIWNRKKQEQERHSDVYPPAPPRPTPPPIKTDDPSSKRIVLTILAIVLAVVVLFIILSAISNAAYEPECPPEERSSAAYSAVQPESAIVPTTYSEVYENAL